MKILHRVVSLSRILHWIITGAIALVVVLTIAGLIVVRTQRFRDYVRRRIVEQVETATNARFEFKRFYFDWERLTAEITGAVLHGKETEGPPLVGVDSVTVGFRIISLLERKIDLARIRLERPHVHIIFYGDGSTNIPSPGRKTTWSEDVVDLAVRDYEALDGVVEYDETRIPLRAHGENLRIRMSYNSGKTSYTGDLSTDRVQLAPLGYGPIPVAISAAFTLDASRLAFSRVRVSTRDTRIDLAGTVDDMRAPRGAFSLRASGSIAEAVRIFKLPLDPAGTAALDGKVSLAFAPRFDLDLSGKLSVQGAGYSQANLRIANGALQSDLALKLDHLSLRNLQAQALGAQIAGQLDVSDWAALHFEGAIDGLATRDAAALLASRAKVPLALPWTGEISGPVSLDTNIRQPSVLKARANLAIAPASGGIPVQGAINAAWDAAAGALSLEPSWIATASTRVDASGTLGKSLALKLHSTNLDDLLPALALTSANAPRVLPVRLNNGTADLDGTLNGVLDAPTFAGKVSVTDATVEGHSINSFSADLRASKDQIQASRLTLSRGATTVTGSASAAANINQSRGSFDDPSVTAQLEFRNAALGELIPEAAGSTNVPGGIAGMASGKVAVTGTLHAPEADITADIQRPAAFSEQADRLRIAARYTPVQIQVTSGEVTVQNVSVRFNGTYRHPANDWNTGQANIEVSSKSLPITRIHRIAQMEPSIAATLSGDLRSAANIVKGAPFLTAVDGTIAVKSVSLYQRPVGEVSATLQTRNADLSVRINGKLRDTSFEGSGGWRLEGDDPGSATIHMARMSLAAVHSLAMLGGTEAQQQSTLPFDGSVEGSAIVSLPLRKPEQASADVTLAALEFTPRPGPPKPPSSRTAAPAAPAPAASAIPQDIVLRNSGPVAVHIDSGGVRIAPAQFTALDTALAVSGAVPFGPTGADVAVRGNINLAILRLLNASLLAKGSASVDASVRGAWRNPALNGRMQLSNASLYLTDLPNGVDNVNGSIVFDRNRATIERLTAETGGGRLSFGGALEFSNELVYRLQADAQQVRVRYPEDISTSLNAHLELSGTPDASTLSGTVTLNRTALSARADLGRLMSQAARPTPAPANPSEYLRGMQFDIRVESAPDFELDTALTREVQTALDLRLRGTPLQPSVLGAISVNTGEFELGGNRFSIDRGDIRFLNPLKIDPVLDMSLETRARGIAVNVSLSGSLQKLRVNYSSDPPLQPSEIIALLAVGRSPTQSVGITNPSATGTTDFSEAGGGLLGDALSAQLSSRLQRFFGASRVKIDPTMTGVDNQPQARLTFEQQISKDITMTYITNLNYTQEQTVRVQWDFDRQWSAVAVRDANGLFGIDVQYRRRF